jgi:membrane protein
MGAGLVLILSVTLGAVLAATAHFFESVLPIPEAGLQAATIGITFLLVTFVFAAIYKLLPDVHLEWNDVWIGAGVTALLFSIGRIAIQLYLEKVSFTSAYGAAGSLVVVLIWIYYSAQLFFLGAEFTKVFRRTAGSAGSPHQA